MIIHHDRQTHNLSIIKFMMRQLQPYWSVYRYGSKLYIMTFQYNVYEVTL